MARSIVVGIVGDSGAGKTTVTRGLTRVLGDAHVTHISADDYHRYDRRRRAEVGLTPLNPDCNHLDILTQHLIHLRRGEPVLKPVYDHRDGSFRPPEYVRPGTFLVVEGLLNFHTETLRSVHDVLVALAPPEELRRAWKLKRDCTRRGYTTDEVLAELDRRQRDAEAYVHPQRAHADIVVSFVPGASGDPKHLDADVILRDTLPHPDLGPLIEGGGHGPALDQARARVAAAHPGRPRSGARRRARGGRLGADELRQPPAHPAPRRVHGRDGPAALRLARARAAADPLPRGHGAGGACDRRLATARRATRRHRRRLGSAHIGNCQYIRSQPWL